MFLLNWKPALTIVLYAAWCSQLGLAQVAPHTILNVNVENIVVYYEDVSDASTFATNPNVKVAAVSRNFQTSVLIGDIVSVNGQPTKGVTVHTFRTINLRTAPTPGQAIADLMRANSQSLTFEFLRGDDSTPIGTIMASGLGGAGAPPPGAPLMVTQGNNTIVGGTGAFLGARGQQGQAVTSQTVSNRQASMTEDPANRRQNGGGKTQFVLDVIPISVPQIVTSSGAPAILHADFSPVTAAKPAKAGEVLIAMATGLGPTRPGVDPGQPFPPYPANPLQLVNSPVDVTVNGQSVGTISAIGWPRLVDTYQVDFQVPAGTPSGMGAIQLTAAWITGSSVNIPIQ